MKKLTKTNPITFAGNNGALTVWWGADWQWHAHRHYHMALRDELACKTKKQIRQWLTDAFPIVR